MKHGLKLLTSLLLTAPGLAGGRASAAPSDVQAVLQKYCFTCHSTLKHKGDLDLETSDIGKEPHIWQNVIEQVQLGEMPPKKEKQPTASESRQLLEWTRGALNQIALANAGDPGPVVLRRLSNMEYTYTLRDLTGVDALDPAKEFPADGAAGEGFTNAGAALVMWPALLSKYLDAGKDVSSHLLLTPTGVRFSTGTSSRDWTDEALGKIRAFYAKHTGLGEGSQVVAQGIKLDVGGDSGRVPLARYLDALQGHGRADGLSQKYLGILKQTLKSGEPSVLLDPLRKKFQAGTLTAADIEVWQTALWRFNPVGHIGRPKGPKAWQEAVSPLAAHAEFRMKLRPPSDGRDLTLYLTTRDVVRGNGNDFALWENARFILPGRSDLPLRDARALLQQMSRWRQEVAASAGRCLAAAGEAESTRGRLDVAALARKRGVDEKVLRGWLTHLGVAGSGQFKLEPLLAIKAQSVANHDFIKGWAGDDALSVLANSSDVTVRIPGEMKPHSVATHPAPKLASVIAWRSPVDGTLRISGTVQDGDTACGNGILYLLELRRGHTREVLASGESKGGAVISMGPFESVRVMSGDVIALVIDPRAGNHACDHTPVNLTLNDGKKEWDLAKDVSPDILAGNPHADRHGNDAVWHFLSQPAGGAEASASPIDSQSLLSKWRKEQDATRRAQFADQLQQLLKRESVATEENPADRALRNQLLALNGPILADIWRSAKPQDEDAAESPYSIDPAMFGKHPRGGAVAETSLCVQVPSIIELKLPAAMVAGMEFAATVRLNPGSSGDAGVQMQVLTARPAASSGLVATSEGSAGDGGDHAGTPQAKGIPPVLVQDGSAARGRLEKAFDEFRAVFPAALCYTKIVPVDEVVTLTLFHREDEPLRRLMLTDDQTRELDRLWSDLLFVSEAPLKQVDAFEQIYQYATQDRPDLVKEFELLREPIRKGADAFRALQIQAEAGQVQAMLDFAGRAWRRGLSDAERDELRALYGRLRGQALPHAGAMRLMLARVLTSPAFLYRGEKAAPGTKSAPVTDQELATRLSYFLWSSTPDDTLARLAAAGKLQDPDALAVQAQRMLKSDKVRRLALEFGCQYLHVRDVATLDEKSERHFPTFAGLRGDMQEEVVRFFIDLIQNDRSIVSLLDADHTFVNANLAKHYGLDVKGDWQRVEGMRARGRGGMFGFAAVLSRQSGASRTSAILRGTWLSEVVLGEKLPLPPKGVPVLPGEPPEGLTERQLIDRHSSSPTCVACHRRIDPFGFALEGFDAIGRIRKADTGTVLPDGTTVGGMADLRVYIVTRRQEEFSRQFCRKLLGFALGRSVQLSDKPLIDQMVNSDLRFGTLVNQIILSRQFREVRGRDYATSH